MQRNGLLSPTQGSVNQHGSHTSSQVLSRFTREVPDHETGQLVSPKRCTYNVKVRFALLREGSNGCLIQPGYVITVTALRCGNANDVSVNAYGRFVQ